MKYVRISKNIEISALGSVYFEDKNDKYLVIGDLHIGLEKYMREQGVFMQKRQLKEIKNKLNELLSYYGSDITLIVNGDLKHDFKKQEYEDKEEIKEFIIFAIERFKDVIIIRGNHDNYLINITEYLGKELVDKYETDNFFIMHGDKPLAIPNNKHIILHHEHPTIQLRDDVGGKVRLNAFLVKKHNNRHIIVSPAFSYYSPGIDILKAWYNKDGLLNKFNIDDFIVYGSDGIEIYEFDKLKILKEVI